MNKIKDEKNQVTYIVFKVKFVGMHVDSSQH
jgi:hypothetical protein